MLYNGCTPVICRDERGRGPAHETGGTGVATYFTETMGHLLKSTLLLTLLGAPAACLAEGVEREVLPGSPAPQAAPTPKPSAAREDLRLWVAAGIAALPTFQKAKPPPRRDLQQHGFRVEE